MPQKFERYASPVDITAEDIGWFRRCRSCWIESEAGAPAVVPAGLSLQKVAELADGGGPSDVYERLERVLCAFFLHGRFVSGGYALNPRVLSSEAFTGVPDLAAFDVSADHVRLFSRTSWRANFIDTKRPYGDYQAYELEMAQILGLPLPARDDGRLPSETETRMQGLHHDMLFVLQAFLQHAELEPGRYQIPWDGWGTSISPRCSPVPQGQLQAYVQAMDQSKHLDEVARIVPRFQAAALLFGSD